MFFLPSARNPDLPGSWYTGPAIQITGGVFLHGGCKIISRAVHARSKQKHPHAVPRLQHIRPRAYDLQHLLPSSCTRNVSTKIMKSGSSGFRCCWCIGTVVALLAFVIPLVDAARHDFDPNRCNDLIVAGAGPGGLYSAWRMIEAGLVDPHRTCIFEQTQRVGEALYRAFSSRRSCGYST